MNLPARYLAALLVMLGGCASPRPQPSAANADDDRWPGARKDGTVLLPNQWSLDPVGKQVRLGDFPVNIAVHPSGRHAAVLHCGYGTHEIIVVDVKAAQVVSRVTVEEAFYGLAFDADGRHLYCSGAGKEVVHRFDFADGQLSGPRPFQLRDPKARGIAAGLALTPDGRGLWVANLLGHSLSLVDFDSADVTGTNTFEYRLADRTTTPPTGENDPWRDVEDEAITKRARALLEALNNEAPYPYACVIDPAKQRLYVSLWGKASVEVIDLNRRQSVARWSAEDHPNEMILARDGRHLFVANANLNTVSVIDTTLGKTVETLTAELQPNSPPGSTPNSLALSPDETLLFVANANINAIAVFDVAQPGRSRALGFIPVGWYPTSVRLTPDGRHLLVANGKGLASRSNRYGPQPGREAPATVREYIGGLMVGSLSIIDLPADRERLESTLRGYTDRAYRCRPPEPPKTLEPGHPIPQVAGGPTPLRYCIYIIKENRTYDQVLGDMPEGRGDPTLCLFPEEVTPNHHKLAREFVLLDNFYVESEVSADGHEWTVGGYATDYVEKMWPMSYGHNRDRKYAYPSEGRFKIAEPAGGYLWDRAKAAGVTYRSYGEFVNNGAQTNEPCTTLVKSLQGHFDPWFRSFDMDYSDLARADRFLAELARFEREGEMPRLQIVRLPNDHTAGTSAGKLTPTAFVAENDLALGRVIEGISRSRFWPQTAVFVVEDDAQNGPDHIDAHRTVAYVISPYVRRGTVDSSMFSTCSMLRTMELILGLKPMTQFDAAAMPMHSCFSPSRDTSPFIAAPARVDLTQRNLAGAWGSELSGQMDFAKEDAADDLQLNEIIWRSVRGPEFAMPAPVRAGFVRPAELEEEEDDD
ncbi:MAG: beta-propeller fold lactonase family protein [Verrucomicrobiales bacterium]|nr:beta-propeller fold lactonase family protein [Verrucomicrobiales bacterium]